MPLTGSDGALGATFKITRALQAACMIAIIGMTSNFVSQIISINATPPTVLVGTLTIVCIATLYCVITFILYVDNLLPHLISTTIDSLFLIALIVVSVIIGKPISYLNCTLMGDIANDFSSSYGFASALAGSLASGGKINYSDWIGTSKSTCLEMKSIWGLCIALCILFFLSAVTTTCLWRRNKQIASTEKGEA